MVKFWVKWKRGERVQSWKDKNGKKRKKTGKHNCCARVGGALVNEAQKLS